MGANGGGETNELDGGRARASFDEALVAMGRRATAPTRLRISS